MREGGNEEDREVGREGGNEGEREVGREGGRGRYSMGHKKVPVSFFL